MTGTSDAQLGMLEVKVRRPLIGARESEQATFAVELTDESEANGSAGPGAPRVRLH